MTSGQEETERVYSFNPEARMGSSLNLKYYAARHKIMTTKQ